MSGLKTYSPAISVVMSFYSGPLRWIEEAVHSILSQSFHDFEFIIICDNPDNAPAIGFVQDMAEKDSRIRLVINESHIGITKSLNIGMAIAKGRYIARMDADDIAYPDRLRMQAEFLEEDPSRMFCCSDVDVIDKDGRILKKRRNRNKTGDEWIYMENHISHPSVMFRRELLELRKPLYDEFYRYSQDYELWIFLLSRGVKLHMIKDSLIQYRVSDINISSAHRQQQNMYFQQLHRNLLTSRLKSLGIVSDEDCRHIGAMLEKTSKAASAHSGQTGKELLLILYILYFTQAVTDRRYILKYFLDRNMIFMKIRPQLSYQMLRAHISGYKKTAFLDGQNRLESL